MAEWAGFTIGRQVNNVSNQFQAATYTDATALGGAYLRAQCPWFAMELTPAASTTYSYADYDSRCTMTIYDAFVLACNAANIKAYITVKQAPSFAGYQSQTVGTTTFPDPTYSANFGMFLAQRYNGATINLATGQPYGLITVIEDGNEDFSPGNLDNGGGPLGLCLARFVPAVKSINPNLKVGAAANNQLDPTYIQAWYAAMYANCSASALATLDFVNFHFYPSGAQANPSISSGTHASFTDYYGFIRTASQNAGYAHPIWCTELGWPINTNVGRNPANVLDQATQWSYFQYCFDAARGSWGKVTHIFPFTINETVQGAPSSGVGTHDGDSLVQDFVTTSYTNMAAYTVTNPTFAPVVGKFFAHA